MADTFFYPGNASAFVPQAQAALQVNYSRNPDAFKLNKYVTIAPVSQSVGYYIVHDYNEETRIPYSDGRDFVWSDGAYPSVNFTKGQEFVQYFTKRYSQMFTIGDIAQQNTAPIWSILSDHADTAARRLMLWRTVNVLNKATDNTQWAASNTADVTAIPNGGHWDAGTDAPDNYIQISINYAVQQILLATNGTVQPQDLVLVVGPKVAYAMSQSAEYRQYLKSASVDAKNYLQMADGYYYGLGDSTYGIKTIVETSVQNTAAIGATRDASFVEGNFALLLARPGALEGPLNTMGTLTLPMFSDLSINMRHNDLAMLTEGVVHDNYDVILRSQSGFLFTNVLA